MKERETKKLYESISNVDDQFIEEAQSFSAGTDSDSHLAKIGRRHTWARWGVLAACLCCVLGAFIIPNVIYMGDKNGNMEESGAGRDEEGYSVAVYPATEREEDVASADVESLTENEIMSNPLAKHLPRQLPKGFHYGRGSVYHTVMKNGAEYSMLRIEYTTDEILEQKFTTDGGAVAPDPDAIGETFIVCVMNYEPATDNIIFSSIEEVTQSLLKEKEKAYIRLVDCYIGVFVETSNPAAVLDALKYID